MDNPKPDKLITLQDAGQRLGVDPVTVGRHLPTVKLGHRRLVRLSIVLSTISGGGDNAAV